MSVLRMTAEEFEKRQRFVKNWAEKVCPVETPVKKAKFGNVKTAGSDSKKESKRLGELRLLQAAGAITALMPQVCYTLIPAQRTADGTAVRACTYTCDAQYIEGGKLVVEDVKSEPTRKLPRYNMAKKLMLQLYGIEIREI